MRSFVACDATEHAIDESGAQKDLYKLYTTCCTLTTLFCAHSRTTDVELGHYDKGSGRGRVDYDTIYTHAARLITEQCQGWREKEEDGKGEARHVGPTLRRPNVVTQLRTAPAKIIEEATKYHKSVIGTPLYGAKRRCVENLGDLAQMLGTATSIPDGKHLCSQVNDYRDKQIMILGHGAGMLAMLYMPPGGAVIEVRDWSSSCSKPRCGFERRERLTSRSHHFYTPPCRCTLR